MAANVKRPCGLFRRRAVAALVAVLVALSLPVAVGVAAARPAVVPPSQLSVPWPAGETARLLNGPHTNNADVCHWPTSGAPCNSLDLVPASGKVTAARGGIVHRPCGNLVMIDHGDGWVTGYYHLINIQVIEGQPIPTGTWLGNISEGVGCGGFADGNHVHFFVKYSASGWGGIGDPFTNTAVDVDLQDFVLGGWRITKDPSRPSGFPGIGGCMTYVATGEVKCTPNGLVTNYGGAPPAPGSVGNLLASGSFEATAQGWGMLNPGANFAIYQDVPRSHDGHWLAEANTGSLPPDGSASLVQDVGGVDVAPGRSYDFSVWLRSPTGQPFAVCVALWAIGGTAEPGSTCKTNIGSAWSLVTAPLDIHGAGHSALRAQIYLHTATINVDVDGAQLVSTGLQSTSFEGGGSGWSVAPNTPFATYNDVANAHDGQWFAEMNTGTLPPDGSASLFQDAAGLDVTPGKSYDFSVWLRSPSGQPISVCVVLWALGGTNEPGSTCTIAGPTWAPVTAPLDIHGAGHNALRAQVYLYTAGPNVDIDGAQLTAAGLSSASFEGSTAGWALMPGTSFASYQDPTRAHDGYWFGEANRGTVPPDGDASIYQDITGLDLSPGQSYDFTWWVRSPSGQAFSACVKLFAIGGTLEGDSTCRTAIGSGWTSITVPMNIVNAGHTTLRAQLYLNTPGINLDFDGATLSAGNAQVDPSPPGPPRSLVATAGDAQATVGWTPPASDGGSPVTGYTVTASPGGATVPAPADATSATVTGLTNGVAYTFTVTATNAVGAGPASAPSNSVTPQPDVPVTVTRVRPGKVGQGAVDAELTVTGTGFVEGASVSVSAAGVVVGTVTVQSATRLTARVTVPASQPPGSYDLTVTNPGGPSGTCAGCLKIGAGPTVTSVAPPTVAHGTSGQPVTVNGTGFKQGAIVQVSGTKVTVVSVTFVNATTLHVVLNVGAAAALGARTVTVTNPDLGQGSCAGCLTVT